MEIIEILEQEAIFDGKPDFIEPSLIINTLNHRSYGGGAADLKEARESGELLNPKRYLTRIVISCEEVI